MRLPAGSADGSIQDVQPSVPSIQCRSPIRHNPETPSSNPQRVRICIPAAGASLNQIPGMDLQLPH